MPRIYRYRAEPASAADAALLDRQLWLAGDYRRVLARIENAERAAVAALYREDPAIVSAETALADALRDRDAGIEDADERVKTIAEALRGLRKARGQTEAHRAGLAAIRERRGPLVRSARRHAALGGLYWGTYLTVEDAHDRACRTRAPWEPIIVRGGWETVAVQIQSTRPLTGAQLVGDDTRVRLSAHRYPLGARVDHYATEGVPGQERNRSGAVRAATWQRLSIRVGSDGRAPVWARLHVDTGGARSRGARDKGHTPRAIPPDARISWVRVHRTHVGFTPGGPRYRWEIQFVIDEPEQRTAPTGVGVVGIDIGWRRVDGGIRVGYAALRDRFSELVIPDVVLRRRQKADDLRSIRDRYRDTAQALLRLWRDDPDVPDWYREATSTIHTWRRIGRYVPLVREMRTRGLWPSRTRALEFWLERDRHLLAWENNNRRRMRLEIEGRARAWIAHVLDGHDVLGIEAVIRIDKMRGRATADSESIRRAAVAHAEVAPGALRTMAIQMAKSRGIRVVEVDPAFTTACPCGAPYLGDRRPVVLRCDACGREEDQDRAAAQTIARDASAVLAAPVPSPLDPRDPQGSTPKKAGRRNRRGPGRRQPHGTERTSQQVA